MRLRWQATRARNDLRAKPLLLFRHTRSLMPAPSQPDSRAGASPAKLGNRPGCPTRSSDKSLLLYRFRFRRALLCVDHHAFECINRAQHLWVLGLDDVDFVAWFNVPRVPQPVQRALLFGGHADANVWRHAITLNDLPAGRVVLGSGKTHRGSIRQLQNILHGTFSKSGFTNKDRAAQILKGTRNDLRAARAAFVDQQHHRKTGTGLTYGGSRVIMLLRRNPALRRNDSCVRRQKLTTHVHGAVQ